MKWLVLASIVVFIGFLLFFCNWDERIIRKKLTTLTYVVSKSPKDSPLSLVTKTQKIRLLFSDDCKIFIERRVNPSITGMDKLTTLFHAAYEVVSLIEVSFSDIYVIVAKDRKTAIVHTRVNAKGIYSYGEDSFNIFQEAVLIWERREGKWTISVAKTIDEFD